MNIASSIPIISKFSTTIFDSLPIIVGAKYSKEKLQVRYVAGAKYLKWNGKVWSVATHQ